MTFELSSSNPEKNEGSEFPPPQLSCSKKHIMRHFDLEGQLQNCQNWQSKTEGGQQQAFKLHENVIQENESINAKIEKNLQTLSKLDDLLATKKDEISNCAQLQSYVEQLAKEISILSQELEDIEKSSRMVSDLEIGQRKPEELKREITEKEKKITKLEKEIASIERDIADRQQSATKRVEQFNKSTSDIVEKEKKLASLIELRKQRDPLEKQLVTSKAEEAKLDSQLEKVKSLIDQVKALVNLEDSKTWPRFLDKSGELLYQIYERGLCVSGFHEKIANLNEEKSLCFTEARSTSAEAETPSWSSYLSPYRWITYFNLPPINKIKTNIKDLAQQRDALETIDKLLLKHEEDTNNRIELYISTGLIQADKFGNHSIKDYNLPKEISITEENCIGAYQKSKKYPEDYMQNIEKIEKGKEKLEQIDQLAQGLKKQNKKEKLKNDWCNKAKDIVTTSIDYLNQGRKYLFTQSIACQYFENLYRQDIQDIFNEIDEKFAIYLKDLEMQKNKRRDVYNAIHSEIQKIDEQFKKMHKKSQYKITLSEKIARIQEEINNIKLKNNNAPQKNQKNDQHLADQQRKKEALTQKLLQNKQELRNLKMTLKNTFDQEIASLLAEKTRIEQQIEKNNQVKKELEGYQARIEALLHPIQEAIEKFKQIQDNITAYKEIKERQLKRENELIVHKIDDDDPNWKENECILLSSFQSKYRTYYNFYVECVKYNIKKDGSFQQGYATLGPRPTFIGKNRMERGRIHKTKRRWPRVKPFSGPSRIGRRRFILGVNVFQYPKMAPLSPLTSRPWSRYDLNRTSHAD